MPCADPCCRLESAWCLGQAFALVAQQPLHPSGTRLLVLLCSVSSTYQKGFVIIGLKVSERVKLAEFQIKPNLFSVPSNARKPVAVMGISCWMHRTTAPKIATRPKPPRQFWVLGNADLRANPTAKGLPVMPLSGAGFQVWGRLPGKYFEGWVQRVRQRLSSGLGWMQPGCQNISSGQLPKGSRNLSRARPFSCHCGMSRKPTHLLLTFGQKRCGWTR